MKSSVLLVGNFLSASHGTRFVCEDLAARLEASGWSVLTTSKYNNRLTRLLDMVITSWRQRLRYDVAQVDVYSGLAFFWAEVACWVLRKARKRYILTLHGGNLPAFAQRWPVRVRHLLASATVVTTPSRYLQEQMCPYRTDLRLLPNPLEIGTYNFRPRERPKARTVWLRAFHEIYNPSLAVKVAALLAADFQGFRLTMIGPDKRDGSLTRLRQLQAKLGVADYITVVGSIPKTKVSDWLNDSDIFLNTTNFDNAPVSVLEAMACGLCIVSTNVGGIPYLLEDGHDSLLVRPDDPEAMANAVRRIMREPNLGRYLSENARLKAEKFNWSTLLPQWEDLLVSVAKGQKL